VRDIRFSLKTILGSLGIRGVGHTYAMLNGAKNTNQGVVVIAATSPEATRLKMQIGDKAVVVSLNNLESLRGLRKPVVIEHTALEMLFIEAIREIDRLEFRVNQLQREKEQQP
jgi:hypothetical protein